jgi:porin
LGFTAKWNITDKTSWIGALYDGNPTDFDHNPYNMKWQLVSGDGILAVSEIQHHINGNTLPGTYKLGIYSRNHLIERIYRDDLPDSLNDCKLGVYMYADKKLWKHALKSLDVFVQAGYSPTRTSLSKVYLGFGMNLTGFLSRSDVLGFAIAYVNLTRRLGSETTVELTWKKQLGENIFVQPDLQYIIHPSGNRSNIGNCLAGILRVGLSF